MAKRKRSGGGRGEAAKGAGQGAAAAEAPSLYERERSENIKRNEAFLSQLGLKELNKATVQAPARKKVKRTAKKSDPSLPRRTSSRVQNIPPAAYDSSAPVPTASEYGPPRSSEADLLAKGYKCSDEENGGVRWAGEMYGEVPGVPVGTVFGAGDHQRLGRKEMAERGFFVPWVQPEWFPPKEHAYALILNNDNGSGSDSGDTFIYVGGGGRHRGQNRTAKQVQFSLYL